MINDIFKNFFNKGEIVWADFGNIRTGSELMGKHWSIVFEANNALGSDTIVVVPISSYKGDRSPRQEIQLGRIIPGGKVSLALVNQITRVSKQRILSRHFMTADGTRLFLKLTAEQIKDIEKAILKLIGADAA